MGDHSARTRLFVLAVILAQTLGHFAYMGLWRHLTAPDFDVNDFKAYYTAALAVRTGQADSFLYSDPSRLNLGLLPAQPWVDFAVSHGIPHPSAYIYPPFFAILLAPLTLMAYHEANLAWFALNAALMAGSVALLVRLAVGRLGRFEAVPAAAVAFVSLNFYPTIRAMQCGQAGFVLLFLIAAALAALLKGRDATAGFCLALASAIKLTPIVLIVWLAWAGRRRAAAWAAGFLAGFASISILIAGWANHVLYVTGFLPSLSRGAATYANQSINGFLNRLLTEQSMTVFDFSNEPVTVWILTRLAAAALMIAAFAVTRPWAGPETRRLELGYGLVVLTTLLVSPISWEHHYILALLPLALMIGEAARAGSLRTIGVLSVAYVAMAVDIFELIRRDLPRGSRPAMSYVLCGGLLLWLLTARAAARRVAAA
jgi:hypothetical protein